MLKRYSEFRFIAVTLVVVVLMGARTFASLTEDEVLPETHEISSTKTTVSSRSPASVPKKMTSQSESALRQFTQYDLRCAKKGTQKVSVNSPFLQLQGKHCLKSVNDGEVEIFNKSNGYTASIFQRGSDNYQTDLIQLQKGENEITIRYREPSGKSVEEVVHVHSS